jgi:two-component system NarL family sensor kinase
MELMPPDFSKLSLKDTLSDLCAWFSSRTAIKCACYIDDELDCKAVSAENQLHLYRMVQEAFTNIEKHSKATEASLVARRQIGSSTENILICVSDDGVGLRNEPENHRTFVRDSRFEGLGMMSMRQRAAIIGAKLDFISESENGLMVRIELPLTVNLEPSVG